MTFLPNLAINPQRLWDSLMETARFGGMRQFGIKCRPLASDCLVEE